MTSQSGCPERLRFSERELWERALQDGDSPVLDVLMRLSRTRRLLDAYEQSKCEVCGGVGAVDGFWLGTIKTCPACHGKGRR